LFSPLRLRPPRRTSFPYTTLFRSEAQQCGLATARWAEQREEFAAAHVQGDVVDGAQRAKRFGDAGDLDHAASRGVRLMRKKTTIDRKSTRLNSSHEWISYAVFCLK